MKCYSNLTTSESTRIMFQVNSLRSFSNIPSFFKYSHKVQKLTSFKFSEVSSQAPPPEATVEEWQPIQVSSTPQAVPEDSRYTWNSGNSRIPYINYYRENVSPFIERNPEVSVQESKKTKPTIGRRSNIDRFRGSSKFSSKRDLPDSSKNSKDSSENSRKFKVRPAEDLTRQTEIPRDNDRSQSLWAHRW